MNASHAELEIMRQSLSNFQDLMCKEIEEQKDLKSNNKNTPQIDEKENESDEEYNDDFEEIEDDEIPPKKFTKSNSEDSIEEELNVEIDEDSNSDDIEDQMENLKFKQVENNYSSMNPPKIQGKKRAISAKYQLRSLKQPISKTHRVINQDKMKKSVVIEALKEENK